MSAMTLRGRILAVYAGQTPDTVPFMLDLSHWFYHRHRMPWDLSRGYEEPEYELIDYHKQTGVGFYLPNLGSFYDVRYGDDVVSSVAKSNDGHEITWTFETPLGTIQRTRRWEEQTYAWGIPAWGVRTEHDLKIIAYALSSRTYSPKRDRYQAWVDAVGDTGIVYLPFAYSAMGHLLNYWLGIEQTVYATAEWFDTLRESVDAINANNLRCIEQLGHSPAEVVLMGDNFSSDIQPPYFFDTWSRSYYEQAIDMLHRAGKRVAIHIDGRLRGMLDLFRELGADCADAVTPKPMGDLAPIECREEAGPDMILSGGVSPNLWLPESNIDDFRAAVLRWIELRRQSPRLIANAGDQVPPGAEEDRIRIMRDMVEQHGKF